MCEKSRLGENPARIAFGASYVLHCLRGRRDSLLFNVAYLFCSSIVCLILVINDSDTLYSIQQSSGVFLPNLDESVADGKPGR
jgi:hypothetical protein